MRSTASERPARRRVRGAGLAVWIALASPLAAQDFFVFGPWTGTAELHFGLQRQESSLLVRGSSLFERELMEERLLLRNTLTVVDTDFLLVNYGFNLGLLRSQVTTQEQEGAGDGRLVGLDLLATFLPVSPRRGGELRSSSFFLDEDLRLQHRKSLSSSLRYVGQQRESFSGPPTTSQRGILGLHHRLYQSLETDLTVERARSSSRAGTSSSEELGLSSTYRKNLPGRGRLTARFTGRYEMRDSLRGDGQELLTEERHVAHFGVPSRLERPGVIPGSVVVTDEPRTTVYDEGVDYELAEFAEFVEIVPLPGGRIRDGDILVVEYRVTAPRNKTSAIRNAFEVSLNYAWVEPFWGFREVDREVFEGAFDPLQDDQKDSFAGLRLPG